MNSLAGGIGQVISIILQSIFVRQHFSPGLVILLSSEAGNVDCRSGQLGADHPGEFLACLAAKQTWQRP